MKTLMTLSSGVEITYSEASEIIHATHYEGAVFNNMSEEEAQIRVLFSRDNDGVFGVLRHGINSFCLWSIHMSTEEAVKLHELLPNVAFKDDRVGAAESLADVGGAA